MAMSTPKKIVLTIVVMTVFLGLAAGFLFFELTTDVPIDFRQAPNTVEAHEATRKLQLFTDAQKFKRQGFIRLSEVEINSFLEKKFHTNNLATNLTASVIKSGVLLGATNITFVTWVEKQLFGFRVPFVWQRTIQIEHKDKGCDFTLDHMRLGNLAIPKQCWPWADKLLGPSDHVFDERQKWVQELPGFILTRNELDQHPEIRLYTFVPRLEKRRK